MKADLDALINQADLAQFGKENVLAHDNRPDLQDLWMPSVRDFLNQAKFHTSPRYPDILGQA